MDLDGSNTYRLRVPPNVPINLLWSVVAYDRETHGLIRDMSHPTRASNTPELVMNEDGSVDVWFAPEVPEGKESNWINLYWHGAPRVDWVTGSLIHGALL